MARYICKIETPDVLRTLLQELQALGAVGKVTETSIELLLDADTEYDLGYTIRELESSLHAMMGEPLSISHPQPVTEGDD